MGSMWVLCVSYVGSVFVQIGFHVASALALFGFDLFLYVLCLFFYVGRIDWF